MPQSPARPNVVLIFADDMTHWALTSGQVATPHLDRLAARGTTFSHAFNQGSWSGAVCVPARAMLLSGRTLFHAPREQAAWVGVPTLPQVFGDAGYRTFFTGKWHQPDSVLAGGYHEVGPRGGGMLFPNADVHGCVDVGRPATGNDWNPSDPSLGGHWLHHDGQVVHSSQLWADSAVDFLGRPLTRTGADRPFFLHLAFHAPHDPRQSPAEWLRRYPAEHIRVPPTAWPEHPFDQGDHFVRDEMLAPFPRTHEAIQLHRSEYFAILSHADAQIGRVLDALDHAGHRDDTIVVFSGDHGLALGEHGLMGKQSCYDHSVRVPLVLAGPRIQPGLVIDDLVYQASIFPTLCELAQVPLPDGVEFCSLASTMAGSGSANPAAPAAGAADALLVAYKDFQRLIRTRTHALIASRLARRVQLFDLRTDLWQAHDVAADPANNTLLADLLARMRELQRELGDTCGDWTADADGSWAAMPSASG